MTKQYKTFLLLDVPRSDERVFDYRDLAEFVSEILNEENIAGGRVIEFDEHTLTGKDVSKEAAQIWLKSLDGQQLRQNNYEFIDHYLPDHISETIDEMNTWSSHENSFAWGSI